MLGKEGRCDRDCLFSGWMGGYLLYMILHDNVD